MTEIAVPNQVIAWFAAGVINDHVLTEDEDIVGCCPNCCGPCAALVWLRDNAPDGVDAAIVEHLGADWDWQVDGRIDWPLLNVRLHCQSKPACEPPAADPVTGSACAMHLREKAS